MGSERVLVTGSEGMIAYSLIKRLRERGYEIRGADIKTGTDLRIPQSCEEVTKDIDVVYHLAADKGGIQYLADKGTQILRNNQLMNLHMLDAAVKNNVKKFLFVSSACVYPLGMQEKPGTLLKETDALPAQPDGLYGWEKLMGEFLCNSYRKDYGIKTYIVRPQNPYGAGAVPTGTSRDQVIEALCYKAIKAKDGDSLEIWGDGKQGRGFFHVLDCADGMIDLTNTDYNEPINLGPESVTEVGKVADLVIAASGKKLTKKFDLTKPRGSNAKLGDLTLARKVINWNPKIGLEEGVRSEYEWIVQHMK